MNTSIKLTEHFNLKEFINSSTANKQKINNNPTNEIIKHIKELCVNILEPLRKDYNKPIIISSEYRCNLLNIAVGGSDTSAHTTGWAADLQPLNSNISEFKAFVIHWLKEKNIKFDQCINEHSKNSQWIHIALYNRNKQQRKEFLIFKNGVYTKLK